jgi:uncharacterized membrane protein
MPDWAPALREIILFTGVCELAGALGLVTRPFRWWAAVMLAFYAACVFPANIKHAFYNIQLAQLPTSWRCHAPRLALQPVIVWWALYGGRRAGHQLAIRRPVSPISRGERRRDQLGANEYPALLPRHGGATRSVYRLDFGKQ